jgi:hypothetical protein
MSKKTKVKPVIHITKGEFKTEMLMSISTNTLTNPKCIETQNKIAEKRACGVKCGNVCGYCFSYISLKTYKQLMVPALQRNSVALSSGIVADADLPLINSAIFRFQSHGDLINLNHLVNLVNIAVKNPHVVFGLWTKRTEIMKQYVKKHGVLPSNIIKIYSNPAIDKVMVNVPAGYDKVFNAVTGNYIEAGKAKVNCSGQCVACRKCYIGGETVIVEHLKNAFGGVKIKAIS